MNLTLEALVMVDRPDDRHRAPLHGLMECAGLKPSSDELSATGYDVTAVSLITDEVAQTVLTADHVFLPFTINRKTDLGKLLAEMLTSRTCFALPEFDYTYFGPPPGDTA